MANILAPALAETAIITYRDVRGQKDQPIPHLPVPSRYVAVGIVYGALALFPERGHNLAVLIGWGFVVATLLNLWGPRTKKPEPTTTSGAIA